MMIRMRKRRNGRRRVSIAALLLSLVCSGCGSQEEQGPIVITYGTLNLDIAMESWIASWNQSQDTYRIEVKSYEDSDTGRTQLNNEIVAGKGPDLLDLSNINVADYAVKGVLEDLYPYLDKDGQATREMLMQGVLESFEFDGKLCGIPMGYSFETLLGKKQNVGEAGDWTMDKMLTLMQGLKEGEVLMDALSPEGFLRATLAADMGSYVDLEKGECYFEGISFHRLLETAAGLKAVFQPEEAHAAGLADGSILLERAYISDVSGYLAQCDQFGGEEVSWVGFPSCQGGKAVLYTRMPIGMSALSEKKDGAWAFIASLLGEEFQEKYVMFLFPVRISALEKSLEAARKENVTFEGRTQENGDITFEGREQTPVTQEQIEALTDLISNSRSDSVYDPNIWNIVREEAAFLFDQGKDVEEVMQVIQNRALNYIQERMK